jgi:hypothetical protein
MMWHGVKEKIVESGKKDVSKSETARASITAEAIVSSEYQILGVSWTEGPGTRPV